MGVNRGKYAFVILRDKRKLSHWFVIQNYSDWFWQKDMPLKIFSSEVFEVQYLTSAESILPVSHLSKDFCKVVNWFQLIWHMLCNKNINQGLFYSILQLTAYAAYRSLQRITNVMVRQFRKKVPKIILAVKWIM